MKKHSVKRVKRVRRASVCLEFIKFLKEMDIYGTYRLYFLRNIEKSYPQNYVIPYYYSVYTMRSRKEKNCNRSLLKNFAEEMKFFKVLDCRCISLVFFRWVENHDNGKNFNISKVKLYTDLFWMYLGDKGYAKSELI